MRRLTGALVLALAFGVSGCEDLADPDSPRTTYTLSAVNGEPLPAIMFEGDTEFGHVVATAQSGILTLRETTYSERMIVDLVVDGAAFPGDEIVSSGSYSIDGQLLTFDPDQAGRPTFTGTLQGGVLEIVEHDPDFGDLALTWEQ